MVLAKSVHLGATAVFLAAHGKLVPRVDLNDTDGSDNIDSRQRDKATHILRGIVMIAMSVWHDADDDDGVIMTMMSG